MQPEYSTLVLVLQEIFAAARVVLSLAVLVYSSWSDYKTREVSNKVWAIYAPMALVLILPEMLLYDSANLPLLGLSIGVTVGFAFLLFYAGGFGGADSKALMCIAIALPFFPISLLTPLLPGGLSPLAQILFPITILSNAVLVAALSALYLLVRNLVHKASSGKPLFEDSLSKESAAKKLIVLITGKKFSIATLKAKWHVYPMEDIVDEPQEGGVVKQKRKLVLVPKDEGRDEIVQRLSIAAEEGKIDSNVWATPGLPMLIFVTVGLILALTAGDLVWLIITHLFG
jgi:archaeal preflagellin peptidase FlaK